MGKNMSIRQRLTLLVSIFGILFVFYTDSVLANSFFGNDDRYRGWLWFEDNTTVKDAEGKSSVLNTTNPTPAEARAEIEKFSKELEDLRFVMMARPSLENVKAYREKEVSMWKMVMALANNWTMANFRYPELADNQKEPANIHSLKLKRKIEKEEREKAISILAQKFDLVFFFRDNCRYCEEFAPVLKVFGEKHGFTIESVNVEPSGLASNSIAAELFNVRSAPKLAQNLGISATPVVIAMSRKGDVAFELIRGFVTISELEEYSVMAVKYLKHEGKW